MTGARKPALILLTAILSLPATAFAADVTGVVHLREGNRTTPLSRVTVIARPAGGGKAYASTKTDADGAYSLRNLPSPRIQLTAERAGFYVQSAGGHGDRQIVLDCSVAADCAGVDFQLRKGAVITGRIVDEMGEPLQDVHLSTREPDSSGAIWGVPQAVSPSDDRGMFRVAGLAPGAYLLTAQARRRRGPRGGDDESATVEVQVGEGEVLGGVELVVSDSPVQQERYTVSGSVVGVDLEKPGSIAVNSRARRVGRAVSVEPDGSFVLEGLPEGDYEARYVEPRASGERRFPNRIRMGRFSVSGDRSGLVLQPVAPTGIRGRLIIESVEADEMIRIRFMDENGNWAMGASAEGPEYKFESRDFEPGEYRVAAGFGIRPTGRLFVREVRVGGEPTEGAILRLSEGAIEDVEFVLSDDFGKVSGRVKAPNDGTGLRKGAQYSVGLKGAEGVRSVQADQRGRFSFDDIVPGEYQICAWEDISGGRIRSDEAWVQAGAAARTFPVEAGSEIEIDLTAVQP